MRGANAEQTRATARASTAQQAANKAAPLRAPQSTRPGRVSPTPEWWNAAHAAFIRRAWGAHGRQENVYPIVLGLSLDYVKIAEATQTLQYHHGDRRQGERDPAGARSAHRSLQSFGL